MSDENDTPEATGIVSDDRVHSGEVTVKLSTGDGDVQTFENAEIKTLSDSREEAKKIRENAPDRVDLGGRTDDIDDVIEAREEAKERGVDRVLVNDDGRTRGCDPRITNNHRGYHGLGPKPGSLTEWVEL